MFCYQEILLSKCLLHQYLWKKKVIMGRYDVWKTNTSCCDLRNDKTKALDYMWRTKRY
jgi:hypothetical protein